MDKSSTGPRPIQDLTALFIFLAAASLALGAAGERRLTFPLPDSILLFGNYNDLRVVTQNNELVLRPPVSVGYNGGYFAFPSISPRGDSVAWGFAVEWQASRRRPRARFALGVYSLTDQQWRTFGDFDDIGTTALGERLPNRVCREAERSTTALDF